jgi:hypothetical protein
MYRRIARGTQPAQPNPHGLSQRVCYHSLHNTDAAFALPLGPATRSRLPQALLGVRHAGTLSAHNRVLEDAGFLELRWPRSSGNIVARTNQFDVEPG